MPMFTAFTILVLVVVFLIDYSAKTKLYLNRQFWLFQLITAGLTIVFDLFAHNKVWTINEAVTLGISVLGTPLELLSFGFILLYTNVIAFELIQRSKQISPKTLP